MNKKLGIFAGVLILVLVVVLLYSKSDSKMELVSGVSYVCTQDKTIQADFYEGKQIEVKPGEQPIPSGKVKLKLSDGRLVELPQTISASGIRYANADESFIFWSKGNGAFVTEKDVQTFQDCVLVAKDLGDLSNVYRDPEGLFSLRYPKDYSVKTDYQYFGLGPDKEISGVKFVIPEAMATGTNLSSFDTGVSIEKLSDIQECSALAFIYDNQEVKTVTDNGIEYSVAETSGAGLGNFYEGKVWALPGTNPCLAIRYLTHSTNIFNYPTGTIKEFNRENLISQFDQIRRSLILK